MKNESLLDEINIFISKNQLSILNKEKIIRYIIAFYKTKEIFAEILQTSKLTLNTKDEDLFKILKLYDRIAQCIKVEMFKTSDIENIDSHKISSIFLICLLRYNNFVFVTRNTQSNNSSIISKNQERSTFEKFPHIYFSYILGIVIMENMYNIEKSEKIDYQIDMEYGKEFAKLIYGNKDAILHPSGICNNSIKGVFCLSHIFYFIEKTIIKTAA